MQKFCLVFFIPIVELKVGLRQYIINQLFPRERDDQDTTLWDVVKKEQDNILFVLDGLDDLQHSTDAEDHVHNMILAKLLNGASIFVTSRPLPVEWPHTSRFRRRVAIEGFGKEEVRKYVTGYFGSASTKFGQVMTAGSEWEMMGRIPLLLCLLCTILKAGEETVPLSTTDIYISLLKAIRNKERRKLLREDTSHEEKMEEFGNICFQALLDERIMFSEEEVKQIFKDDGPRLYRLIKRSSFSPRDMEPTEFYMPLHKTLNEFHAAYYLKSLLNSSKKNNKFTKELQNLWDKNQMSFDSVLIFVIGLLKEKAHIVFEKLENYQLSTFQLFELLKEAGIHEENVQAVQNLLQKKSLQLQCSSGDTILDGWRHILSCSCCRITSLEFDFQRQDYPCSTDALWRFFKSVETNSSISIITLRSSSHISIPGQRHIHSPESLGNLAHCCLIKPGLKEFRLKELAVRNEELVDALCSTLRSGASTSLQELNLDVSLTGEQLRALCDSLKRSPSVSALQLPQLASHAEGYRALAELIETHQIILLSISYRMGLNDWPESGIDVGSPEDMQTVSTFSSIHNRRAHKKSSDVTNPVSITESFVQETKELSDIFHSILQSNISSVVAQKGLLCTKTSLLPLPICTSRKDGPHLIFHAAASSTSHLQHLELLNHGLNTADYACLGQALRCSKSLQTVKAQDVPNFRCAFAVLSGAAMSKSLLELDLSSTLVTAVQDEINLFCRCLITACFLQKLIIKGWKFELQTSTPMDEIQRCLQSTKLQDLTLRNCRVTTYFPTEYTAPVPVHNSSLLRLDTQNLAIIDGHTRHKTFGPDLVCLANAFAFLQQISVGGEDSVVKLDEKSTFDFVQALSTSVGKVLHKLSISSWDFSGNASPEYVKKIEKLFRLFENLREFILVSVKFSNANRLWLIECVLAGAPKLEELKLFTRRIQPSQCSTLGEYINSKWTGSLLFLHVHHMQENSQNALLESLNRGGRHSIRLSDKGVSIIEVRRRGKRWLVSLVKRLSFDD